LKCLPKLNCRDAASSLNTGIEMPAYAIKLIAQLGNAALLAFLLKMVLKERITDDEIQLICDVYHHDE
jgi:hypothetical protein